MNLKNIIPWRKEGAKGARESQDPFLQLQQRMNGMFEDFLGRSPSAMWSAFGRTFAPEIDISETAKDVRVTAELPGLEEKDVEVTLEGDLLTIRGEKRQEHEEQDGDCWHTERRYGAFQRSVQLPESANGEQARAKFRNGVLKVTIPKKPEAQRASRKIPLSE